MTILRSGSTMLPLKVVMFTNKETAKSVLEAIGALRGPRRALASLLFGS
jgi:hypothetical protein